jgi:Ca2+-binding RTX toxin-like protein
VQVLTTDALGHKFVKDIAINILDANPDLDILTGAFVQNVQENASVQVSLFLSDFNLPEVEIVEVSGDTAFSLLGAQVGMFAPYHNFSVVFTPQDFETPADDNRDNVYDFAITVSNGLETTTRTFHFTVTNVSPETMSGTEGIDALVGTGDADLIFGLGSNDILNGAGGNDILTGGLGKDMLTGGLEADVFDFNLMTETRKGANHDVIVDFNHLDGDHIDLIDIDAKSKTIPNDHFKFIGAKAFHHKAGELHYIKKAGYLLVEGDMDGNGKADFQIEVHGVTKLGALDFNL